MKKNGFTLIELLIVTVVIVTLMGIVFRLAGVGGDSRKKSLTQSRLQRLENALSGYYAAYGSYPPVPLQNRSRDINVRVDGNAADRCPLSFLHEQQSERQVDGENANDGKCPRRENGRFFFYEQCGRS